MALMRTHDDGTVSAVPRPFVQHDGGRSMSRRPRQRLDCAVRAIATALVMDYDRVYDALAAGGRKSGRSTPKATWKAFLGGRCERVAFPAAAGAARVNVVGFCAGAGAKGRWVVQCAKHLFAVIDGTVFDDGQPRWNACVYAAWRAK